MRAQGSPMKQLKIGTCKDLMNQYFNELCAARAENERLKADNKALRGHIMKMATTLSAVGRLIGFRVKIVKGRLRP